MFVIRNVEESPAVPIRPATSDELFKYKKDKFIKNLKENNITTSNNSNLDKVSSVLLKALKAQL